MISQLLEKVAFNRFRTRVWFILSAVYVVSALVIVTILFRSFRTDLIQSTAIQVDHRFELIEQNLHSYRITAVQHALLLSRTPEVKRFVSASEHERDSLKAGVEDLFFALLKTYQECFQARIIDADTGLELVRLNRDSDGIHTVPDSLLQNKKDRAYFMNGLEKKEGECYTSQFDLNKEFGQLSVPHIKTMRVATPLFNGERLSAVLVLNMDVQPWFSNLRKFTSSLDQLYIVDKQNGFLMHPDSSMEFSGFRNSVGLEPFDSLLLNHSKMEAEGIFTEEYAENQHWLIRKKTVSSQSLGQQNGLVLVSVIPQSVLFESAREDTRFTFLLIILALCGGVFVLLWLSELIVRPIRLLSDKVATLKPGMAIDLEYSTGGDEFATLNNRFIELFEKVNLQLSEVQAARKEAESALTAKDEFLGNVSHEIRTPLNTISGLTEVLKQQQLSDKQTQLVETLSYSVDQLLAMINDVLDYNQAVEGKLRLVNEPFSAEELVKNVCLIFKYQAITAGVDLSYETSSEVPSMLNGDRVRITQILNNLVSNSLKFTESGTIKLKAEYDSGELILSVEDTGKGMSPKELETIFERYEQASAGISNKRKGLGLGLSIVKHLVNLMNGRIEVASELDKGTRSKIWIPAGEYTSAGGPSQAATFIDNVKALYVDDVEVNRITMSHIVKSLGFEAEVVDSCSFALASIEKGEFDVILMDLRMPEVDGFQCIEKIKAVNPNLPIIAVSANLGEKELSKLSVLGVRHSVQKPIDPNNLHLTILSALEQRHDSVYSRILTEQCNQDLSLLKGILGSFLRLLDDCIEQLKNQPDNSENLARFISELKHKISPSAKMFSLETECFTKSSNRVEFLESLENMRTLLEQFKDKHQL